MGSKKMMMALICVLIIAISVALFFLFKQKEEIKVLGEQFVLQKEEIEEEYSQMTLQYEGYGMKIENDSLFNLYENEKIKVQNLLEELKTVKATNTAQISKLKKELEARKKIMRSYIAQIDSLNMANQKLVQENEEVQQKLEVKSSEVTKLNQQNKELTETVRIASQMKASNVEVDLIDKKAKVVSQIKKASQIRTKFVLGQNNTAETGRKWIYTRITKPNKAVLTKSGQNTFRYENKDIAYSSKREIEYDGEAQLVSIYWDVEEFLSAGQYRVDIFADGALIGEQTFEIK